MSSQSKLPHEGEGEGDNFSLLAPLTSSSAISSSQGRVHSDPLAMLSVREGTHDDGEDEDDGYQTPTSPRHRIPALAGCPPAPRKRLQQQRIRKRNRAVCICVVAEVDGEDDMLMIKAKKAKDN